MSRSIEDLRLKQAAPLNIKVRMTQQRIREWVNHFGEDGVYVSFSGGKDSTVLLRIVREMYPDVPAVFCDTGLEYPEIRDFVKTFDNVVWLRPKMTFRKVIETYGYPFISKEVSQRVYECRKAGKQCKTYKDYFTEGEHFKKYGRRYSFLKWAWLVDDTTFPISNRCCRVMKEGVVDGYGKETGRVAIIGTMTSESQRRESKWLRYGCNAFDAKKKTSTPMSFWTEQDVLKYVKDNDIKIASVYGEIVEDGEVAGQMTWDDYCGYDTGDKVYKTTGCNRTGCMFCGFGCHLEKEGDGRFERMKITHPKQYEYIMKPWDKGGLGYKEVIDWLNENGNLNIRY